jgi:hypothetical protein
VLDKTAQTVCDIAEHVLEKPKNALHAPANLLLSAAEQSAHEFRKSLRRLHHSQLELPPNTWDSLVWRIGSVTIIAEVQATMQTVGGTGRSSHARAFPGTD